jgi:hypothetical protein
VYDGCVGRVLSWVLEGMLHISMLIWLSYLQQVPGTLGDNTSHMFHISARRPDRNKIKLMLLNNCCTTIKKELSNYKFAFKKATS